MRSIFTAVDAVFGVGDFPCQSSHTASVTGSVRGEYEELREHPQKIFDIVTSLNTTQSAVAVFATEYTFVHVVIVSAELKCRPFAALSRSRACP